jgi:carotenoid cleavage dioxygenase
MPISVQAAVRAWAEKAVTAIGAFNRRRLPDRGAPFLVGVHAPMPAELTLTDLVVTGTIPPGLNGRYLKMGANPVRPEHAGHHWFLGDGMVHGIALRDGRAVWYRNRWILSRLAAAALPRASAPGPRRGINDTVNTNIVEIGGQPVAVVEAGSVPVALSDGLEQQEYTAFGGTLRGAFSGHPHRDPATGEQHLIAYDGRVWNAVRHVVVSPAGRVVRDVAIPVRHGPCVHDCGLTARFVVVLDLPVTFSMRAVLAGQVFPYRWNAGHKARLGLLPRAGDADAIIWCEVPTCFVFHVANAHDEPDGRVVLDVIAYDTMFASGSVSGAGGLDALGRLERWTVDPVARRVHRAVLDTTPQEFPRVDERRFGRVHRYAYTVAVPEDGNTQLAGATRLYKHDLVTGTRQVHEFGADTVPGEFVFVPARADAAEDEGWLLGLVIDTAADRTALVILDARAVEAAPVASVQLPHRIPPGFHGNWFADA